MFVNMHTRTHHLEIVTFELRTRRFPRHLDASRINWIFLVIAHSVHILGALVELFEIWKHVEMHVLYIGIASTVVREEVTSKIVTFMNC
jgi:hypothetical protein